MSILFITHDLGLIERFSDTITVMQEGRGSRARVSPKKSLPTHNTSTLKKLINAEPSAKQENAEPLSNQLWRSRDLKCISTRCQRLSLFKQEFFHAVKDVNFAIPRNSTIGLVGESGSGKSTLGKALSQD